MVVLDNARVAGVGRAVQKVITLLVGQTHASPRSFAAVFFIQTRIAEVDTGSTAVASVGAVAEESVVATRTRHVFPVDAGSRTVAGVGGIAADIGNIAAHRAGWVEAGLRNRVQLN